MNDRPTSPCKTRCVLALTGAICAGCGRTLAEIAEWGGASATRQHDIVRQCATRLALLTIPAEQLS